jgi:hypothetical protein
MNKLYSFVLLSTLLTACGGGGSESITTVSVAGGGDSQPSNTLPNTVQSQPAITEFSLEEKTPMEAGVIVNSAAQSYLSLCSDYQQHINGSYSINYDSCLLRTSLSDINFEAVVTVTNDTKGLVAALWFMDETKKPLIYDWRF